MKFNKKITSPEKAKQFIFDLKKNNQKDQTKFTAHVTAVPWKQ